MTEHMSDAQIARLEALQGAAPLIGRKNEGPFKGSEPVEISDLVDVAEYIIAGIHPLTRYEEMGMRDDTTSNA